MKILAVIPARAGSKGIPNKNIRIVGGHPLIFYAINNALSSKLITDVVVTTDSDIIKEFVSTFDNNHLRVKDRSSDLCQDDVTLDAVIYDAIPKDENWDYVITLQPTSPTLKQKTLDEAIEYTILNDLDTCISVCNKPHLAWIEKDGKVVPSYEKRLNRQYLPPYYMENGAFVISKRNVVTKSTRIGEKINVYPISEDEAIDIDSFYDLTEANKVLSGTRVAIYVNGNNKRGMGHIYRTLEIADELFLKPDIYYDINQTKKEYFGDTTYELIPVNGTAELYDRCRENHYSVFINDILATSIDYMIGLKSVLPKTAQIVNFEDVGEGSQIADVVINALFEDSSQKNVFSGSDYYIAKKNFLFHTPINIKDRATRVFICFGGSDPMNYTDRILKIISKPEYSEYEFRIALGKAKENVDELMKYNKTPERGVFYDVHDMPSLMSSCDVAITSRGRTAYELAILGIPTIVISENDREKSHSFISSENGYAYIGFDPTDEIIENELKLYLNLSKGSRQSLQDKLLSHDLRHGRERVMKLINV